jgi:DNA-binding FadR family transcriptional regulator
MKESPPKKLYRKVYDELKNYIIDNHLKPGDKLPTEMEMTKTLGVSRNVLREAVKAFEIIGVLTSKPGVGIMLNKFDSNFLSSCMFFNLIEDDINLIEHSLEVRKVLEVGFARQVFESIDDDQLKQLYLIVEDMKTFVSEREYYEMDERFHNTLYKNVGNFVLTAIIESTWEVDKGYHIEIIDEQEIRVEKHLMIVKALENHDYIEYLDALDYHFTFNFKNKIEDTPL